MKYRYLFKAKRIDNGEWLEGLVTRIENTFCLIREYGSNISYECDVNTLCQYTGLTDKNGNKIWENDVVKRVDRRNGLYVFREQPKMNCKVVWTDRHGYDTEPSCGYFDKKNALECEVIGNIFDNPELLKVGAKK